MKRVNLLTPNIVLQNRYRIVRQIGRGGMGAVYKAIDTRLHTTVALKQMLMTEEPMRRAFEKEALLLARLRHRALPRVIDHFTEDDGQFLVMDYISGDDLATLLARNGGRFPPDVVRWALRWADQLLDALDYLHTQTPPIYHRDIKPQNLKLTGSGDMVLLDFGLARGGNTQLSTLTANAAQSIAGFTPNYAPLEQIRGGDPDPRSDLYSLAATFYHLLTGVRPPDALTRAAELLNAQRDPLRPLSELNPQVPLSVAAVIHSTMAPNPNARPASAAMMRRALIGIRSGAATIDSSGQPTQLVPQVSVDAETVPEPVPTLQPHVAGAIAPVAAPPTAVESQPRRQPGTLIWAATAGSTITGVVFTPEGRSVVVAGDDRIVGVWDVFEVRQVRTLESSFKTVSSLVVSPDGRIVVAGSEERSIQAWLLHNGVALVPPERRAYPSEFLAFSPDGRILASGGWGNAIWLWDVEGDLLTRRTTLTCSFVQSLTFSPDGTLLAAGCYDGSVRIWRVSDCYALQTIDSNNSFVLSVAFSPDGERLVSGGGNTSVRLWRVSDGRLLDTLQGHSNYVRSLAFSPDGALLASGSEDRSVRIWRPSDGAQLLRLDDHGGGVTSVAFSPDGALLISGCRDRKLRLWQIV